MEEKEDSKPKTLFAVRIDERRSKEFFQLFMILGGLALFLIIIFACQYVYCWQFTPKATLKECFYKDR